ncbi:hypothetical protein [Frondihabitans sucicola]|nr:hypothetical protein [Frondihabitans sucicola]
MQLLIPGPNPVRLKFLDVKRLRGTDTHPSRVIEAHERFSAFSANDGVRLMALALVQDLANEIALEGRGLEGRDDAIVAFKTLAAAHGIALDDAPNLRRLALAIPRDPDVAMAARVILPLFLPDPGRFFFHSNVDHHRALSMAAEMQQLPAVFDLSRLPSETGFGWLAGDTETPARLLGWGRDQDGVFIATLIDVADWVDATGEERYRTPTGYRMLVGNFAMGAEFNPRNQGEAEVLATLMAFVDVMERRGDADASSENADNSKERKREKRARTTRATPPVRLMYARGASSVGARAPGGGKLHLYRWPVRGFWRNQWYPSLKAHRMIFIQEHTAGPANAPVRGPRPVVNVYRENPKPENQ